VKENITTRGVRLNELAQGQRLDIGESVLEVTGPCQPCSRMDEIRMGLQQELHGQRWILCRVAEGGRIRRGDAIQMAPTAVAAPKIGGEL
jgi:MOSC domain-containing protein YiiM